MPSAYVSPVSRAEERDGIEPINRRNDRKLFVLISGVFDEAFQVQLNAHRGWIRLGLNSFGLNRRVRNHHLGVGADIPIWPPADRQVLGFAHAGLAGICSSFLNYLYHR